MQPFHPFLQCPAWANHEGQGACTGNGNTIASDRVRITGCLARVPVRSYRFDLNVFVRDNANIGCAPPRSNMVGQCNVEFTPIDACVHSLLRSLAFAQTLRPVLFVPHRMHFTART